MSKTKEKYKWKRTGKERKQKAENIKAKRKKFNNKERIRNGQRKTIFDIRLFQLLQFGYVKHRALKIYPILGQYIGHILLYRPGRDASLLPDARNSYCRHWYCRYSLSHKYVERADFCIKIYEANKERDSRLWS
uniref:Ribosomal protein S14 n=1 Tax=Romanomermis culicivorax TaxID=13658 RepID=A0A915KP20_ROMCU